MFLKKSYKNFQTFVILWKNNKKGFNKRIIKGKNYNAFFLKVFKIMYIV